MLDSNQVCAILEHYFLTLAYQCHKRGGMFGDGQLMEAYRFPEGTKGRLPWQRLLFSTGSAKAPKVAKELRKDYTDKPRWLARNVGGAALHSVLGRGYGGKLPSGQQLAGVKESVRKEALLTHHAAAPAVVQYQKDLATAKSAKTKPPDFPPLEEPLEYQAFLVLGAFGVKEPVFTHHAVGGQPKGQSRAELGRAAASGRRGQPTDSATKRAAASTLKASHSTAGPLSLAGGGEVSLSCPCARPRGVQIDT